jgi:uncharacterized protein
MAMSAVRGQFGLTLMVSHACNLRCAYCYTGAKFNSHMPAEIGLAAIHRAFASLASGGRLDLSFFGGEPLIESARILDWMHLSRNCAEAQGKQVCFNLTTNGTITHSDAWRVMMSDDLDLAVSFDGSPEIHNRHRRDPQGHESAGVVEGTLRRLIDAGKPVRVNAVIRPDTLEHLPDGLIHMYELGVRQIDLSLDLWTKWTAGDGHRLEKVVDWAAKLWRGWLPDFALNWFDIKAGALGQLPSLHPDSRCGFGEGEVSVAPSGRLYPCERLIGEDTADNPWGLPGNVWLGVDFLDLKAPCFEKCATCSTCALNPVCDTGCRCSNFIRSGDANRPDGLLCLLNKAVSKAVSEALQAVPQYLDCVAPSKEIP